MEPEEFQSHELYDALSGLLVRPSTGTCRVGAGRACYDYFVVDPRQSGLIESVETLEDAADTTFYPHFPVRMKLRARAGGLLRRILARPRALPVQCPIACQRAPVAWPVLPDHLNTTQQATELWQHIAEATETEMLNRHDIVGCAEAPYRGRGAPPRWVLLPVLPGKLRNKPRGSAEARLCHWLARRITELWHLTQRCKHRGPGGSEPPPCPASLQQLQALQRLLSLGTSMPWGHWAQIGRCGAADCEHWHWSALPTMLVWICPGGGASRRTLGLQRPTAVIALLPTSLTAPSCERPQVAQPPFCTG